MAAICFTKQRSICRVHVVRHLPMTSHERGRVKCEYFGLTTPDYRFFSLFRRTSRTDHQRLLFGHPKRICGNTFERLKSSDMRFCNNWLMTGRLLPLTHASSLTHTRTHAQVQEVSADIYMTQALTWQCLVYFTYVYWISTFYVTS